MTEREEGREIKRDPFDLLQEIGDGCDRPLARLLLGLHRFLIATGGTFVGDDLKWLRDTVTSATEEYLRLREGGGEGSRAESPFAAIASMAARQMANTIREDCAKQSDQPESGKDDLRVGAKKPYEPPAILRSEDLPCSECRMFVGHKRDCGRNPHRQARLTMDLPAKAVASVRFDLQLLEGVTVGEDKYRFYMKDGDYRVFVDRGGEEWLAIEAGSKAILSMMMDLIETRKTLDDCRRMLGVYV